MLRPRLLLWLLAFLTCLLSNSAFAVWASITPSELSSYSFYAHRQSTAETGVNRGLQNTASESPVDKGLQGSAPETPANSGLAGSLSEPQIDKGLQGNLPGRIGSGLAGDAQSTRAAGQPKLCEVYYFHTDPVGLPEELTNAQGQRIWQASYKTWGNTVREEWAYANIDGSPIFTQDQGQMPDPQAREQNLRFQGQYLDRDTGLHYNTFRYYDPDIGRFISPDPIGLNGGINLSSYAPNPVSWIDPWGWCRRGNAATKKHMDGVRDQFMADNPTAQHTAGGRKIGTGTELSETYLRPINGGRKGGSYADMTFTDAQGRTVYVQTVDKGTVNGMSQREWNNAVRITNQDPSAIVITVPKGNTVSPGALDTSTMTPGQVTIK